MVRYLLRSHKLTSFLSIFSVDFLIRSFFVSSRSKLLGRNLTDVVIFDTTAKITRYGFVLAVFTVIDPEYRSRWLASALLLDETEASFARVFRDFCSAFGDISLLMTDEDRAIEAAVERTESIQTHGLCGWHVAQNLRRHVLPRVTSEKKEDLIKDFFLLSRCGDDEAFERIAAAFMRKYTPLSERSRPGTVVKYIKALLRKSEK